MDTRHTCRAVIAERILRYCAKKLRSTAVSTGVIILLLKHPLHPAAGGFNKLFHQDHFLFSSESG
jgi:hypothetical protein